MHISATKDSLISLNWHDDVVAENANEVTNMTSSQLDEYFAGIRKIFDLPLLCKGTEFQRQAWQVLQKIPYSQTLSYSAQANQINNPKAVRAIGLANSKNPISIIIPCHRVVGANGKLTGYNGGIERKDFLLKHEAKFA